MRFVSLILLFISTTALAQQSDTTLNSLLSNGKFSAHTRSFFMSTINDGDLTDYNALAIGAGIGYESPEYKKFRLAISGFFIYNISSSNLSKPDPLSNTLNRYEVGLFDVTDPGNRKDLDRLEELYLQYRLHKSFIRVGKMILSTPFINPQDGRMRPTLEQGIWADVNEFKNTNIHAGWITHISPRSTVKWYEVDESIGIYPVGLNENGTRSDYAGNLQSKGIALLGLAFKNNITRISFWNTFIENISNTAFAELEKDFPATNKMYYGGLQFIRQDGIRTGGNDSISQTYITPGTYSNIVSGRVGLKTKRIDVNLNGTYFTGNGRYLMPREWGRDPFYTFMPRERNEGLGDVKAVSVNLIYTPPAKQVKLGIGLGHYDLPDVRTFALNKYAMPSYMQMNIDVRYKFTGFLEGTSFQFLYVYKLGTGYDYENPKNIINKVDMSNINIVLNYRFETPLPANKK